MKIATLHNALACPCTQPGKLGDVQIAKNKVIAFLLDVAGKVGYMGLPSEWVPQLKNLIVLAYDNQVPAYKTHDAAFPVVHIANASQAPTQYLQQWIEKMKERIVKVVSQIPLLTNPNNSQPHVEIALLRILILSAESIIEERIKTQLTTSSNVVTTSTPGSGSTQSVGGNKQVNTASIATGTKVLVWGALALVGGGALYFANRKKKAQA